MRPYRFYIVAIILLAWGAFTHWPTPDAPKPEKIDRTGAASAPNAHLQQIADAANATGIGWDPAAVAVATREEIGELPGVGGSLAWQQFTEAYIRDLARRRSDAIAWTHEKTHGPIRVVLVGVIHLDNQATQEGRNEVVRSQMATYAIVQGLFRQAQVITIEESGSVEGPLSWDGYVAATFDAARRYEGISYDRAEIVTTLLRYPEMNFHVPLLHDADAPPIIFGEELVLHHLQQRLTERYPALQPGTTGREISPILMGVIAVMRSEMTLVRALEFLRANGGDTAVITQGLSHADDYDDIVPNYRVDFDIRVPVKPKAL